MRIVITAVLLAVSTAISALMVGTLGFYDPKVGGVQLFVVGTIALWAVFAAALVVSRGIPVRATVALVLIGSAALGGAAITGPPNTSTDSARYAWDGIVQTAGISPYDYVPADPQLASLRPDWLFPAPIIDSDGEAQCARASGRFMTFEEVGTGDTLCSAINRAPVPTIYPPVAEFIFFGARVLLPADAKYWPMQLVGLLGALVTTALLVRLLLRSGRDPRWAALWGWCPLVFSEGVTNSHIDIIGVVFVVVAAMLAAGGRGWRAGIALGLAIATKLIPVIAAPAMLGKQPVRVIVAAAATFALCYVPYVILSGIEVLGYLPGYLTEEGYDSGSRFVLLSPWFPGISAAIVAGLLIAVTAAFVWRLTDLADPWLGQLAMIGVTLLVVSPRYPWYALLLIPMIAMTGRWEWLGVPAGLLVRLLSPGPQPTRLVLAAVVVMIVVVTVRRAGPAGLAVARDVARHPMRTLRRGRPLPSDSLNAM
ncbi:hypothetical protein BH11ACT3_BH11ACT3_21400 [soil metagenome]